MGGRIQSLTNDLGAVSTPGLQLVARDSVIRTISGCALHGEHLTREIRVCGPGAFTILKARAFRNRGARKDAFDLYYVLKYFEGGTGSVAEALRPLMDDPDATQALEWLDEDFSHPDSIGPMRIAFFRHGKPVEPVQVEALALVRELLRLTYR